MRISLLSKWLAVVATGAAWVPAAGAEDIVTNWNAYLRETMKRDSVHAHPGYSTRSMAIMNGAIYDCFQAIRRTHEPFHVDTIVAATTSRQAAASAAGYQIAKALYPAQNTFLTWAYQYSVGQIPESADKAAGIALGESVAAQYLAWRATDGHDSSVPYQPRVGPGRWWPDPEFLPVQTALGPEWGAVATFGLINSQQVQPPPPPALDSQAYTAAFNEVKNYGARISPMRSQEQFAVGLFWAYDRSGIGPPPVLYNWHLAEICLQRGTSEEQNARLFALASVAMADAAICVWDAKFDTDFWRPVTGVRKADTDGNPDTEGAADWMPHGAPGGGVFPNFTPPFPSYVSGHAGMGQAVFQALIRFYGTDHATYSLTSSEMPGAVRYYQTFSAAAQENADSRVWLGVHWRFDQTEGQVVGTRIADYVADTAFQPLVESFSDFAGLHHLSANVDSDSDYDGRSNFAEYAFGTHPLVPDLLPDGISETIGGVPCLVIHYSRQASRTAAGLVLTPEVSANLNDWNTNGITDEVDPGRASTETMQYRRAWIPVQPGNSFFLRLKAQF